MRGSIRKVSTQRNGRSNEKYVEWAERLRKIETLFNAGGCRISEESDSTQRKQDLSRGPTQKVCESCEERRLDTIMVEKGRVARGERIFDATCGRRRIYAKTCGVKKTLHIPGGANEQLEVPTDPNQTNSGGANERALRKND